DAAKGSSFLRKQEARKPAKNWTPASAGVTAKSKTLFLFDEPTTGLHFDDVAKLLRAFRQLIAACDWIIDLGPEGGEAGGEIVCTGMPKGVMQHPSSHTGKALREYEAVFKQPETRNSKL